jgi:hypothetical protein
MKYIAITILAVICLFQVQAVNICDTTVANYAAYSYGYNCQSDFNTYISISNVTSTNKVLKKTGATYTYVDLALLVPGDIVRTIHGDTEVLSNTASTITAPEVLNSEKYVPARGNSAYKQLATWLALDKNAILPFLKPATTFGQTESYDPYTETYTYTQSRNYNEYVINEQTVLVATDTYKPILNVNLGPVYCESGVYNLIYYDTQRLLINAFGADYSDIKLTGRLSEFAEMVAAIMAVPGQLAFVNDATLFDFEILVPACSSHEITTANGFINVNGLTVRT